MHGRRASRIHLATAVSSIAIAALLIGALPAFAQTKKVHSRAAAKADQGAPIFVNMTRGMDDLHAASMGLAFSLTAVKAGRQVVVFLNVSSAAFAAEDLPASVKLEDFPSIRQLLSDIVAAGGKIYVCGHCANLMKVDTKKLLPGIALTDQRQILDAIPPHALSLSY